MHSFVRFACAMAVFTMTSIVDVSAHDDSKRLVPQHGGTVVEATGHRAIEMVVSGTSLVFHVSEHGKPHEVMGSSFKVIIQTGAGTRSIVLTADGSMLKVTLDAPLTKGTKIAITGKDQHGEVVQARFVTN